MLEKKYDISKTIGIARNIFDEIQTEFPSIKMILDEKHKHVELNMDIPKQNGVIYEVNLNLQNYDELHLSVSNFLFECFPCTDPAIALEFKNIVIGYLKGNNRILEFHNAKEAYKAKLQTFQDNKWKTIATWSKIHWPFPLIKTKKIIINKK